MASDRKVLIADPELESVRELSKALRQKGYQVHYAPDGAKALEVTVLRKPDLVLFDDACQMIEARTFQQILRANPRTDDVPVVLTTASFDQEKVRTFRDGYLLKPFNLDEVLARIEHVFLRSQAAREIKGETREIEGNLSQLAIPDLLQLLAMNRRSGRLSLERGAARGEIYVAEGKPVNAKSGQVEGEKAFFRLLAWTDGSFAFHPGAPPQRMVIQRSMDDAVLEGMRQVDELARLAPGLPPAHARLVLAPTGELSGELHPVTAEVVELLRTPRSSGELLDLAKAGDLDVLAALSTLLQKGLVRPAEERLEEGSGPLLGPAEVHALRARLMHGRPMGGPAVGKLFVCASTPAALRRVLREVPGLTPVGAEPSALKSGFGTLARFPVSESLQVDLCALPQGDAARPLWRPFSTGALGVLLLDGSEVAISIGRYLGHECRLPVAVLGEAVPQALTSLPAGAQAIQGPLVEALRALLVRAASPDSAGGR